MKNIRASFRINEKVWKKFKNKSQNNEQDASKLLRLFIKKYNKGEIELKDLLR